MSSRTTIVIASALVFTVSATLYVYWTRTPQYILLHVLNAYATADHQAAAAYIENEQPLKKGLHVARRSEKVIQHLTRIQNETLARAYGATVEESRIDGTTATLRVKVGEIAYQLSFEEHIDGRWRLMDFEERQAFGEGAIKGMKPNHFMIIARI